MITVFAENNKNRSRKAGLDLPAPDRKIAYFLDELGAVSEDEISVRSAMTGAGGANRLPAADTILTENIGVLTALDEYNLLAYLLARMDGGQTAEYEDALRESGDDFGGTAFAALIDGAYAVLEQTDAPTEYTGANLKALLAAERTILKPYPEMNKDVFWKMIADARAEKPGAPTKCRRRSWSGFRG